MKKDVKTNYPLIADRIQIQFDQFLHTEPKTTSESKAQSGSIEVQYKGLTHIVQYKISPYKGGLSFKIGKYIKGASTYIHSFNGFDVLKGLAFFETGLPLPIHKSGKGNHDSSTCNYVFDEDLEKIGWTKEYASQEVRDALIFICKSIEHKSREVIDSFIYSSSDFSTITYDRNSKNWKPRFNRLELSYDFSVSKDRPAEFDIDLINKFKRTFGRVNQCTELQNSIAQFNPIGNKTWVSGSFKTNKEGISTKKNKAKLYEKDSTHNLSSLLRLEIEYALLIAQKTSIQGCINAAYSFAVERMDEFFSDHELPQPGQLEECLYKIFPSSNNLKTMYEALVKNEGYLENPKRSGFKNHQTIKLKKMGFLIPVPEKKQNRVMPVKLAVDYVQLTNIYLNQKNTIQLPSVVQKLHLQNLVEDPKSFSYKAQQMIDRLSIGKSTLENLLHSALEENEGPCSWIIPSALVTEPSINSHLAESFGY